MEDCLFCMIAEGKIPSKKLYEDEQVVAFYDINPQAKVHFLVVPKKHITSAAALTEEDGALLGHIFAVIAKLAAGDCLRPAHRLGQGAVRRRARGCCPGGGLAARE